MANEKVGVSLTKIIENGEQLASNIDRGVKVVKERGTVDAFDRVCTKVEDFFNSIKDIKLSGDNRTKVITILKSLMPALQELALFKQNVLDVKSDLQNSGMTPSPSM